MTRLYLVLIVFVLLNFITDSESRRGSTGRNRRLQQDDTPTTSGVGVWDTVILKEIDDLDGRLEAVKQVQLGREGRRDRRRDRRPRQGNADKLEIDNSDLEQIEDLQVQEKNIVFQMAIEQE